MASPARRLSHNAPGDFFVDRSCIDCDTCRWMAPATFTRREGQASVAAQPGEDGERLRAEMALLSCPTGSIGVARHHDLGPARQALPGRIDGPVYHCGYHAESSFGAAAYLIVRPEGNVLVDSPRFTAGLVRRLEELGGVRLLFLTHRDDVADHASFRRHFACERILHRRDLGRGTRGVERVLEGDQAVVLAPDLLALPTPGHTAGSICLLHADRYLFSGDHVAWSDGLGQVYAFHDACWHDWGEQTRSMERLATHRFEWILPGHGRRCHFPAGRMNAELARAVEWMRRQA